MAEKPDVAVYHEILATYRPRGSLGAADQKIDLLADVLARSRLHKYLRVHLHNSLRAAFEMGRQSVESPSPLPLVCLTAGSGTVVGLFVGWLYWSVL